MNTPAPTLAPKADRDSARRTIMHRMKTDGYGWEDALAELRRVDLMSRRPSETRGQAEYVRWHMYGWKK